MKPCNLILFVLTLSFFISSTECGVLSWIRRSLISKRIVDSLSARTKRSSNVHQPSHCPDGTEKVCSCMDGSVADLSMNMCPEKSSIVWQSCKCPPGYSFQGKSKPKGETRGLGKMSCDKEGTDEVEKILPICKCTDDSIADITSNVCGESTLDTESCYCL